MLPDEDSEALKSLFDFDPRPRALRVCFNDGEELELEAMNWWHDQGEAAHGTGIVVRMIRSARTWKQGSAVSFPLEDVELVFDAASDKILFKKNAHE